MNAVQIHYGLGETAYRQMILSLGGDGEFMLTFLSDVARMIDGQKPTGPLRRFALRQA
jgi:hypothetical protein